MTMGSTDTRNYESAEAAEFPTAPMPAQSRGWKSLDGLTKVAITTCALMVLTVLVPPVGFVLGVVSIGFAAAAVLAARKEGHRNGAAFNTLMVSSLALAMLVIGSLLFYWSVVPGRTAGAPIPVPDDAPAADAFITMEPIGRNGATEAAVLDDRIFAKPIEGTVVHLANATSIFGTTVIYLWDEMTLIDEDGVAHRLSCIGNFSEVNSGGASCSDPDSATDFNWGEYSQRGKSIYEVLVWNAVPDGVWISVETETGAHIVSDIANGVGFVEYQEKFGPSTQVTILDINHELLWARNMG